MMISNKPICLALLILWCIVQNPYLVNCKKSFKQNKQRIQKQHKYNGLSTLIPSPSARDTTTSSNSVDDELYLKLGNSMNKYMSQIFRSGKLITSNVLYPKGQNTDGLLNLSRRKRSIVNRNKRKILNEIDPIDKIPTRWPKKTVPYVMDETIPSDMKQRIIAAMDHWQIHTCIQFIPYTESMDSPTRVYISKRTEIGESEVCSAGLGYKKISGQMLLGSGCTLGRIIHEIGHIIGFAHEHSRMDRDQHVTVNYDRIPDDLMKTQFDKLTYLQPGSFGIPYDLSSIMHYGTLNNEITAIDPFRNNLMGQRHALSFLDIKLANIAYKCSESCNVRLDCENEGFMDENCKCVCPMGFTGVQCETLIKWKRHVVDRRKPLNKDIIKQCGGEYELNASSSNTSVITIQSPNYPQNYATNIECNYLITSSKNTKIKIKIIDIDLRESPKQNEPYCMDSIEMKYYNYGQYGPRFCGSNTLNNIRIPYELTTNKNFILITFRTSITPMKTVLQQKRGFKLEISPSS